MKAYMHEFLSVFQVLHSYAKTRIKCWRTFSHERRRESRTTAARLRITKEPKSFHLKKDRDCGEQGFQPQVLGREDLLQNSGDRVLQAGGDKKDNKELSSPPTKVHGAADFTSPRQLA